MPSIPRGGRCSSRSGRLDRPASARSQRPVPVSRSSVSSIGNAHYEASTKVQAIHPPGLPLACRRPDGTDRGLGVPLSFAPRRPGAGRRTSGWDRPSSTDLNNALRHQPNLQSSVFTRGVRPRVARAIAQVGLRRQRAAADGCFRPRCLQRDGPQLAVCSAQPLSIWRCMGVWRSGPASLWMRS